jgi:Zn-dependent protease
MFDLTPAVIITRLIVLLVAVYVHENAHGFGAYLMGDDTAMRQGINIYWMGLLIGVLAGFAILGSAPVDPYRMRNSRLGMFIAVAAGPVSNLLLAAVVSVAFRFGLLSYTSYIGSSTMDQLLPSLSYLFSEMVWLNVLLFVFNLLPLYPLDGWTVLLAALPPRPATRLQRYQQESMFALFGLVVLSFVLPGQLALFSPLRWLVGIPSSLIVGALVGG